MRNEIIQSIKKESVYAVIPARSGSKGIPHKNIRLLGGYPMIAYSIIAARLTKGIDRVLVSTDSKEYADIALRYGAEVPVLRPGAIAQDQSTDFEFLEHLINWLFDNGESLPEYFVHLRPITPLRDPVIIGKAIRQIQSDANASSLRSAQEAKLSPYKWFRKDDRGYYHTIIDSITLDDANNPRQIFPQIYIPNGYVDVLKTKHIVRNNQIHGDRMIGFETPESIDIDYKEDIDKLNTVIKHVHSVVYDFLRNNYKNEA